MFETTTPFASTFDPAVGSDKTAQLCSFAWPELVARLAAARDVRRLLGRECVRNGGSFISAAGPAFGSAVGSGAKLGPKGELAINLVGLSGGKATPALCADAVSDAAHVDREAL